jgi:hypothetical protein
MSALPPIATTKAVRVPMVMSALPSIADTCAALAHVCFGPIADILPGEPYVGRLVRANPIALLFADPRRTWQDPQADEAELASLDSKYEASD